MTWTAEDDSTTIGIIGALLRHGYRAAGQLASIEMLACPDVLPIVRGLVWGLCISPPVCLPYDYRMCLEIGLKVVQRMLGPVWVEDSETEGKGETWLLPALSSRRDVALDVLRDATGMDVKVELKLARECSSETFVLRVNSRISSPRTRLAAGLLTKAGLCGGS